MNARNFWLWFGGIWLLCGLPIFFVGLYTGTQSRQISARLDADGRTVDGIVLTKAITTSSSGSSTSSQQNNTPRYRVTFRFTTPDGPVTGEADVTVETWDGLVEREPIRVTYLPDAPQHYRVPGQAGGWVAAVVMTGLGGVFAVLGGFILVRARTALRTRARLEREGIAAPATIDEVRPSRLRINGQQQWSLRYRYQDERGMSHTGTESVSPADAEAWTAGDQGMIRYDPRQPGRSIWVDSHDRR